MKKLSDSELGTLYLRVEKTIMAGHYFFEELSNETKSGNPYQIDLVCHNCIKKEA